MEALGRPVPVAVAVMVVLKVGNECEGVEKPEGTWRECSEGLTGVPVMIDTLKSGVAALDEGKSTVSVTDLVEVRLLVRVGGGWLRVLDGCWVMGGSRERGTYSGKARGRLAASDGRGVSTAMGDSVDVANAGLRRERLLSH